MGKSNQAIITWFYDKLQGDQEAFKSIDALEKKLRSLPDPHHQIEGYLNKYGAWATTASRDGKGSPSFQTTINKFNEEYKEVISKEINRAKSIKEIESINIDKEFDVADDLISIANQKKEELSEIVVNVAGESVEVNVAKFGRGRPSIEVQAAIQERIAEIFDQVDSIPSYEEIGPSERRSLIASIDISGLPSSVERRLRSELRRQATR